MPFIPFPLGSLNIIYRIPHLLSSVFGHVLTRGPSQQTMAEMDSLSWRCIFLRSLPTRLVCERAFSKFGVTHTKLRNKIDPIRVHKMAVVGMEQKRLDREANLARNRKKRKSGEGNTAAADPLIPNLPHSPDSESLDFQQTLFGRPKTTKVMILLPLNLSLPSSPLPILVPSHWSIQERLTSHLPNCLTTHSARKKV